MKTLLKAQDRGRTQTHNGIALEKTLNIEKGPQGPIRGDPQG
jgi:hypothetical protein